MRNIERRQPVAHQEGHPLVAQNSSLPDVNITINANIEQSAEESTILARRDALLEANPNYFDRDFDSHEASALLDVSSTYFQKLKRKISLVGRPGPIKGTSIYPGKQLHEAIERYAEMRENSRVPKQPEAPEGYLGVPEAAAFLGIGRGKLSQMQLPSMSVWGRQKFYSEEVLKEAQETLAREAIEKKSRKITRAMQPRVAPSTRLRPEKPVTLNREDISLREQYADKTDEILEAWDGGTDGLREFLGENFESFTSNEIALLEARFGLASDIRLPLEDAAKELGLSISQTRTLEMQALENLNKAKQAHRFKMAWAASGSEAPRNK